jgi:glycine cleavage system H protein
MNTPEGLFYSESDEWIRRENDGTLTIGITDYAQSELGEIVYCELPEVGATVSAGNAFGVVESVKAVGDLHSPVSGEVVEANSAVVDSPSLVNESPYEQGWLLKLKPESELDTSSLLDATAYAALHA